MIDEQNIWLMIIAIVILLIAAILWVRKRMKLWRARGWPTEAGRVDSTGMRLVRTGNNQSSWVAELKYSYTIQGKACAGVVRRSFLLKSRGEKWLGRYPTGLPLSIRYDPAKIQDSVLFEEEQTVAPGVK